MQRYRSNITILSSQGSSELVGVVFDITDDLINQF